MVNGGSSPGLKSLPAGLGCECSWPLHARSWVPWRGQLWWRGLFFGRIQIWSVRVDRSHESRRWALGAAEWPQNGQNAVVSAGSSLWTAPRHQWGGWNSSRSENDESSRVHEDVRQGEAGGAQGASASVLLPWAGVGRISAAARSSVLRRNARGGEDRDFVRAALGVWGADWVSFFMCAGLRPAVGCRGGFSS